MSVTKISDHKRYRPCNYVYTAGRLGKSTAWRATGKVHVNLNLQHNVDFDSKDNANEWAEEYARAEGLPLFRSRISR